MQDVTLLDDREVKTGLHLSGFRLVPGYQGEVGLPLEAFLRFYAVNDEGKVLPINSPQDLSPLVSGVNSEEEARQFLLFFTSPETFYFFRTDTATVELRVGTPSAHAPAGTVTREAAERINYEPPQTRSEGDSWVAVRDLARASMTSPSARATAVRRRESVSRSGDYRLIGEETLGRIERDEISLPYFE